MQEVMGVLGLTYRQGQIPRVTLATQTELSAVHTPSDVNSFPFQKGNTPSNFTSGKIDSQLKAFTMNRCSFHMFKYVIPYVRYVCETSIWSL